MSKLMIMDTQVYGSRAQVKRRCDVFQRIKSRKEHQTLNIIDFISSMTNKGGGLITGVVG